MAHGPRLSIAKVMPVVVSARNVACLYISNRVPHPTHNAFTYSIFIHHRSWRVGFEVKHLV